MQNVSCFLVRLLFVILQGSRISLNLQHTAQNIFVSHYKGCEEGILEDIA